MYDIRPLTEEETAYLREKKFEVQQGLPNKDIGRPHFILSQRAPFKLCWSPNASLSTMGTLDLEQRTAESIADQIQFAVIKIRNREKLGGYPNPIEQPMLLFVDHPGFNPTVDILRERYGVM